MSKRRVLNNRFHALSEMRGILSAMKTLSLLETQKLTRYQATQQRVVESIESAAKDFLTFFPNTMAYPLSERPVYLLIGSERGFCGDFNQALLEEFEQDFQQHAANNPLLLIVGYKLSELLKHDARVVARFEGPTVVEEVQPVLLRVVEKFAELQAQGQTFCLLNVKIWHHVPDNGGDRVHVRSPIPGASGNAREFSYPPLLNLEPHQFARELIDHYLFAVLHEVFYSSLMAENLRRFRQMDQAVQHLEQETDELHRRSNVLRQEEITQEIEVIMLSAEAFHKGESGWLGGL